MRKSAGMEPSDRGFFVRADLANFQDFTSLSAGGAAISNVLS
jgi:hypothetical protein